MTSFKNILLLSTVLIFSACGKNKPKYSKHNYYYHGMYFGKYASDTYKKGVEDGCQTAQGFYKKDHFAFNHKPTYGTRSKNYLNTYKNGWFLGRNKCRYLLKKDSQ